jgi:hypothetical protein
MHKRHAALLRRYRATFGDVKPSEARPRERGRPRKWDVPTMVKLYCAIQYARLIGYSIAEACAVLAEKLGHSQNTIEDRYYKARATLGGVTKLITPEYLREWSTRENQNF